VPDDSKLCRKCGERKPPTEFSPRNSTCKACHREYQRRAKEADPGEARRIRREAQRRYRAAHPEYAERQREQYRQLRDAVLDHYGRACACCGTTENLSIDHPDGDGAEHRAELFGSPRAGGGTRMYAWLAARGFPEGYQVLCRPCNLSKEKGAACRMHAS
jgi:hypothetical protein